MMDIDGSTLPFVNLNIIQRKVIILHNHTDIQS